MKSNLISVILKSSFLLLFSLAYNVFSQDEIDSTAVDSVVSETQTLEPPFKTLFSGLSSEEIEKNYSAINTEGLIEDVKLVPDPRTGIEDYSQVSDPHNMLSESAIDTLDEIMKRVEDETGYQMAVVCLNSIGDYNPAAFGADLFTHWGIGQAGVDNGFLMLVINDIHRVEFTNGRGTEVVLTDLEGEIIRQNQMIPHFKKNDYVTGIIRGVQSVGNVFYPEKEYDPIWDNYEESDNNYNYNYNTSYEDTVYEYNGRAWYEKGLWPIYLLLCAIMLGLYLLFLIIALLTKDYFKKYHRLKFFTLYIVPILFPVPMLPLLALNWYLMNKWRNTERFSEKTGTFMFKLDEESDDAHLKRGQIKEEAIKSIDYDVWVTENDEDVLILGYKRWFSKYRKCPSCKHKTYYKEYDRTISAATYTSSGTGERKYSCVSCGHSKITRYTIPKKVKSNTSSSGGYSSGGGSYSSGSSGGGGSSWGGGSTGGGGGGSSW